MELDGIYKDFGCMGVMENGSHFYQDIEKAIANAAEALRGIPSSELELYIEGYYKTEDCEKQMTLSQMWMEAKDPNSPFILSTAATDVLRERQGREYVFDIVASPPKVLTDRVQ